MHSEHPSKPRLTTGQATFAPIDATATRLHLFHVSEGIQAEHALRKASHLLAEVHELVFDAAMGNPLEGSKAWLVLHALESSKALVDSLGHGLQFPISNNAQP